MVARADVIMHSFTSKQVALMVTALARARFRDESFMRRLCVKFLPSHVASAELLDLCGILSGMSQLGGYSEETFRLFAKRTAEAAPQMSPRQLSLVANAFSRMSHADLQLFGRLLQQVPRQLRTATGRDIAVLLNAVAPLAPEGALEQSRAQEGLDVEPALQAIALRLPDLLPSCDQHSLALILHAFAQLQFTQKDALDLLTEDMLADRQRFRQMSARQLAMVLNATVKLQLYEPRLLEALAEQVHICCARGLDPQALSVIANASAKLRLGLEVFAELHGQVPRLLSRLTGRQLAMLCHAWAKAHIHNDDLFSLIALPLTQKASKLQPHEAAIAIYGYAHFRKAPEELFAALLRRFAALLAEGAVSDGDLLMVGNALGRVRLHDADVVGALQAYCRREPSMLHLTPQAIATFNLAGSGEADMADDGVATAAPG